MKKGRSPNGKFKLSFDVHEFYLLLSQFAPVAALGWENPYKGLLAEEIEVVQKEALVSLVERALVRQVSANEITLEETVAAMFTACAQPDYSLIVSVAKDRKSPSQSIIHSKENVFVRHSIKKEVHTLTSFSTWDALSLELLPSLFTVLPSSKAKTSPFHVSEDAFAACEELIKADRLAEARKLAKTELKDANVAKAFVDGLSKPVYRSAVVVVPNSKSNGVHPKTGMAIYQTSGQTWLLQPFVRAGKQFIEFKPSDARLISKEFHQLQPVNN